MKIIFLVALIFSALVSSDNACYETLKNVQKYSLMALNEDSVTYADVAIYYSNKAQIDCVTQAGAMDATRHIGKTLESVKR